MLTIGGSKWTLIFVGAFVNVAVLLAEDKPQRNASLPEPVARVYPLRNAEARSVSSALHGLNLNGAVSSDDSTQSLLVYAEPSVQDQIKALVAELDAPAAQRSATTSFLSLKHRIAKDVADVMHQVLSSRDMRISVDEANQLVIVDGRASDVEAARQLAERMDQPQRGMRLTFYFVQGKVGAGSAGLPSQLPEGLREVAPSLARSGLSDLTLLAPMTTNVQESARFQTSGRLESAGEPLEFEVKGAVEQGNGGDTTRLTIRAKVTRHSGADLTLFTVDTTLMAKLGDYVVLAAAPTSNGDRDALAVIVRADAN